MKTSGAYNVAESVNNVQQQHQIQPQPQNNAQILLSSPANSLFYTVMKWISNFILAGCIAYTAYKLIVKVLFLFFFKYHRFQLILICISKNLQFRNSFSNLNQNLNRKKKA